jgi:hypothetical protein
MRPDVRDAWQLGDAEKASHLLSAAVAMETGEPQLLFNYGAALRKLSRWVPTAVQILDGATVRLRSTSKDAVVRSCEEASLCVASFESNCLVKHAICERQSSFTDFSTQKAVNRSGVI